MRVERRPKPQVKLLQHRMAELDQLSPAKRRQLQPNNYDDSVARDDPGLSKDKDVRRLLVEAKRLLAAAEAGDAGDKDLRRLLLEECALLDEARHAAARKESQIGRRWTPRRASGSDARNVST